MKISPPVPTDVRALQARYSGLLLDAYGVLVDESGALPGANALIERMNYAGKAYFVLTNSASHLPETMSEMLGRRGVPVPAERIVSAGSLLGPHLAAQGLTGRRCFVLGTPDAFRYAERAGGLPVEPGPAADAEILLIADQAGFPLPEGLDYAVTLCLRRLDAGLPLHLVLCNPDLLYPKAPGQFGITAGALAAVIEAVLTERYPGVGHRFARLGKPYAPIFEEAARRAGTRNLVMIGDQLATDILGARRFGIDSALVASGLAPPAYPSPDMTPTWWLAGLD
ncbi:MAG: HAD hydrolase-like protein [Gammaproteobacteria bacterium]|jgi:HAD superfamily hydrolase (TIGR01450 family)|nr:HAD hydrolase-like protein [Gammaproteobacteria bacterium]